jgi:hypothetical protein
MLKVHWKPESVVIDVEYRACRGAGGYHAYDAGNAIASLKAGIDGLVDAGIAKNDSKARLSWGEFTLLTTQREVKRSGKPPGITVTVRAHG